MYSALSGPGSLWSDLNFLLSKGWTPAFPLGLLSPREEEEGRPSRMQTPAFCFSGRKSPARSTCPDWLACLFQTPFLCSFCECSAFCCTMETAAQVTPSSLKCLSGERGLCKATPQIPMLPLLNPVPFNSVC